MEIFYFGSTYKVTQREDYVAGGPKTPLKSVSTPFCAKVWVLLVEIILENK